MAFLIHRTADGEDIKLPVTTKPIVLGRGIETDIRVDDEEVSRAHCAIWLENEKFVAKDLRSRNGTYVNDQRVNEAELKPGDRIRIGHCEFVLEGDVASKGVSTIMREVEKEMMGDQGKGFRTILREVVKQVPSSKPKKSPSVPPR
ncbi:MAG: FHA domain-containing protein [Verrucomicrobia bacterium]|nr:FHA domain-containing protein [Verrucomicrobiota bacterium]